MNICLIKDQTDLMGRNKLFCLYNRWDRHYLRNLWHMSLLLKLHQFMLIQQYQLKSEHPLNKSLLCINLHLYRNDMCFLDNKGTGTCEKTYTKLYLTTFYRCIKWENIVMTYTARRLIESQNEDLNNIHPPIKIYRSLHCTILPH